MDARACSTDNRSGAEECSKCGHPVASSTARFCGKCGAEREVVASYPTEPVSEYAVRSQESSEEPPMMPKRLMDRSLAPGSGQNLKEQVGVDRLRQQFGPSPLSVLSLKKEHLLDTTMKRFCYNLVVGISRCIPALWIYGGTLGLAACIVFKYRWGLLLSLTLATMFTTFNVALATFNGMRGVFICWQNNNKHWQAMCNKELEMRPMERTQQQRERANTNTSETSPLSQAPFLTADGAAGPTGPINQTAARPWSEQAVDNPAWDDVFHVVIVATYKTPEPYLINTLETLTQYSQASTHMGVVLAMEEREEGSKDKAADMKKEFGDRFKFITATYHPPNLPGHIKGKASNMCWSFQEMASELCQVHGFSDADQYRIIITNMDDDSEFHENYFEALTYHFLKEDIKQRYLTIWQPPVAHFKNITSLPTLVRVGALWGSLGDICALANPWAAHTPFSSNSMSLVLALAVGGWDPDWVSDDWHMMAKCAVMTEGRCKCKPVMLPLVNFMPEEDECCGTLWARWTQTKRHALGVSEVVFLASSLYLAMLEVSSVKRCVRMIWRTMPLMSKFIEVHFVGSLCAVWPPVAFALFSLNGEGLWQADNPSNGQIVTNSLLAQLQHLMQPMIGAGILISAGMCVVYFNTLKHRIEDQNNFWVKYPVLAFLRHELDTVLFQWPQQVIFGAAPEWIAAFRIIFQLKIDHAVAAMIGRPDMGEGF